MKRLLLLILFVVLFGGVGVNAQRPVGDTISIGDGDYLYDSLYFIDRGDYDVTGYYYTLYNQGRGNSSCIDIFWSWYSAGLFSSLLGEMDQNALRHLYPDLAVYSGGRHITGQEFSTEDDLMVIGLAVCPTLYTGTLNNVAHVVDTSMANRETEYVQLYTIVGGTPQLQSQGTWRFDDPHRYMIFPNTFDGLGVHRNDATCVPLYETMFDTAILLTKETPFILAGTYNNNGMVWTDTCYDIIYPSPRLCIEHYATAYSCYTSRINSRHSSLFWTKYGTFPWDTNSRADYTVINIFPILDTLFGTPCAAVTGVDTAGVDSVWATLMWSADARQHDWQVWYRPTGDTVGGGAVVTVAVPTVTLTGLLPGTEYSVAVRGRCDIDNYSPWSDTLLFTTTQDTTEIIDTTTIDTTQTQGIQRLGNLDRFTRIMPNPASEVVNVLSSYRLESVAVYDLTGRLLLEQPAEGISAVVKVGTLPRGTYIMAIRTQQGVATKKLVLR